MNYAIDPDGNNRRLMRFLELREEDGTIDDEGREILAMLRAECWDD